nr:hypothetical protein L203_03617 [Cryptococcus depauperatus CBS 7841]
MAIYSYEPIITPALQYIYDQRLNSERKTSETSIKFAVPIVTSSTHPLATVMSSISGPDIMSRKAKQLSNQVEADDEGKETLKEFFCTVSGNDSREWIGNLKCWE